MEEPVEDCSRLRESKCKELVGGNKFGMFEKPKMKLVCLWLGVQQVERRMV